MTKVRILQKDCDPSLGEDKSLPNTCYVVEYYSDGSKHYDLVVSSKQVDIFDHYYDKSSKFVNMVQAGGRVNPRNWIDKTPNQN